MDTLAKVIGSAWNVLWIGLLVGAGLPALFAAGLRALAHGTGGTALVDGGPASPAARVVGYVCFAAVVFFIGLGITIIVASGFGKEVSFQHVFPMIVDKHR